MKFIKEVASIRYCGIIIMQQKMGKIEANPIKNFVKKEISESSQSSFLCVVNLHAIDIKLNTETIGVMRGNTRINIKIIATIP
jgi:hypothetical protein